MGKPVGDERETRDRGHESRGKTGRKRKKRRVRGRGINR